MAVLNKNPKVSVIIPTYNSTSTIKRAIDSVINQTYKNWEIIIIEEYGSNTDFSFLKNKKYSIYSNIKLNKNKSKLGRCESRNKGIKLAKGKYIAFLDSDDEYQKNKLKLQVDFMENNPEYIGCGCQMQIFNNNKKDYVTSWHTLDEDLGYCTLLFCSTSWTSSLLFNRKLYIQYNLYNNFDCCEDYDQVINAVKVGKFKNINGPLVNYYYTGNNQSLNKDVIEKEKIERVKITQKYLKYCKLHISDKNVFKYLLCNFNKYNQTKTKFDLIKCKLVYFYIYLFAKKLKKKPLKQILKEKYQENYNYYSK